MGNDEDDLCYTTRLPKEGSFVSLIGGLLYVVITVSEDVQQEILLHRGEDRLQVAKLHLGGGVGLGEATVHRPDLGAGLGSEGGLEGELSAVDTADLAPHLPM